MKKEIIAGTLAGILSSVTNAEAQNIPLDIDPTARVGVLGVNTVVNSAICGIVAKIEDRDVLTDVGKCFAGAAMQYLGMEMGVQNIPVLPGLGLRIVETGTSIIYNTLQGKSPFETLQYSVGFGMFEVNTFEGSGNFYFSPSSILGIGYNIFEENDFDVENTLNYQTLVFEGSKRGRLTGRTLGNVFVYDKRAPAKVKGHEFVHVTQYVRLRPFQLLIPKWLDFIEKDWHTRFGEDVAMQSLVSGAKFVCMASKGSDYCKTWWNPVEAEAYVMDTGFEKP